MPRPVISRRTVLKAAGAAPAVMALPPVAAAADTGRAGVTDHVILGNAASERGHRMRVAGPARSAAGEVEAGQLTERYTARSLTDGSRLTVRLRVAPDRPFTMQLREIRPNDEWGIAYGFRVFVNGTLVHVRDARAVDTGGGVYLSTFVDSADPALVRSGSVEVTVEGTSVNAAYLSEIWAYSDFTEVVRAQGMRVPDRLVFVLGQDYKGEAYFRQRLDYVKGHIESNSDIALGMAVLDYYAVRTPGQEAANYALWLQLSRDYDMPFVGHCTSDWEGTPTHVPDGKGGHFGDLKYQQILWSPQDQTGPDQDVWNGQRLDDLLGEFYEPHYGLSVPNIWGNTPWLTWRNPDLNAYYSGKLADTIDVIRPMLWALQRTGEQDRVLPFSTTTENTYWSKHDGEGVADQAYTDYNGGVERRDIDADFNPSVVAAAAADGVTLDPVNGLSAEAKHWLYKNQSYQQQMFADVFYDQLPRQRIRADVSGISYPTDSLRHNVHSEIYSRKQAPYWSGVYPSQAEGILRHARPGSEYIELDNYSPGGFSHLQKSREFGRLANPNLENSVSFDPADKTLLLRQTYINGSRYTHIYNWQMSDANPPADKAENWVNPFVVDPHPWDVTNDGTADGTIADVTTVGIPYTAGQLRLVDHVDIRLGRIGESAPLRLTLFSDPDRQQILAMRHLSGTEVPASGWAAFYFPVTELTAGRTYYIEVTQPHGRPAYAFPTTGGVLGYRVGLDLAYERDRSLVVAWRRDAADAIANVAADLAPVDTYAAATLHRARSALARDQYVAAYRLAMQADSLRYPVLYQATGRTTLAPFPLTVATNDTIDLDVTAYRPQQTLEYIVRAYVTGPVTFTIAGFGKMPHAQIDGRDLPVVNNAVTVDLTDLNSHRIAVQS